MLKPSIVASMLICLIGCASTSELDGLSACEKVEVLTQRVDRYRVLVAEGSTLSDDGIHRQSSNWVQRLIEAERELAFARDECDATTPPEAQADDGA